MDLTGFPFSGVECRVTASVEIGLGTKYLVRVIHVSNCAVIACGSDFHAVCPNIAGKSTTRLLSYFALILLCLKAVPLTVADI